MLSTLRGEVRRHSGDSSWIVRTLVVLMVVLMIVGAVVGALALTTNLFSSSTQVEPKQTVEISVAPVNPVMQETQPEVAVPAAPVVVDYQVKWTEVQGFDPSTISTEEGIYDAHYSWVGKGGYGQKILPHLGTLPVAVAAARDEVNKDIVLASLDADRYGPYLLLSVDGEQSWCRLNLLPIMWKGQITNGVTPEDTRVVAQGGEIHLYGRYALGAGPDHLYWWKVVVQKSELPCS